MGLEQRRRTLIAVGVAVAVACAAVARAGTSFIPIPEIVADPNEGNTFGLLGVVLFTDQKDEIKYMLAPDATYNNTKGFYPTFRLFGYPTATRRYSLVVGKSTTKDEDYEAEFIDRGFWDGRVFVLTSALFERDSTERFFGFGNESKEANESNYTSVNTIAQATPGVWLLPNVNMSYRMRIRHTEIEEGQVSGLPFIGRATSPVPKKSPLTAPGTFWSHQVAFAYDSRDEIDIPRRGALALVYTEAADRALGSTSSYVKFGAEWRDFIPLRKKGNPILALRALADYTSGSPDVPFWELNSLGGRRSLRAFGGDRFIDFNRSLASAELRTRVWQRRLFGVNAEIELAPFLEAGQVFRHVTDVPVNDLHLAYGLGFRGVVRPQIVGFVDIGRGSEGTAVFTGVNYPF